MKKIKSLLKKLNSRGKTTKEDAGRDYLAEQLEPRVLYSGTVAPDVSADDQPVQEAPSTPDNQPEAIGADGAPATAIEAAQQASAEMQQFVSEGIQIASGETDLSEDQSVVLLDAGAFSARGGTAGALTQEVAAGVLDAAAERWSVSGVLTDQQADALGDFSVQVADLEGDLLLSVSEDNSTIVLDIDAAGREWFVDGSPLDDSEFTDRVSLNGFRADSDAAIAGIDVLTVLMESQGRLLGLDSVSVGRDVSATGIEDGLRRIPFADESLTNPDVVTASLVSDLANAAAQRWEDSGLDAAQLEALVNIEYRVVDLESGVIGAAENGVISIDIDAAGNGWFVDLSPHEDSEFGVRNSATSLSANEGAAGEGVDLLSVIMHEQGHILGLEHVEDSSTVTIMTDLFSEGDRRLIEDGQAEGATPGSLEGEHFATFNTVNTYDATTNANVVDIEATGNASTLAQFKTDAEAAFYANQGGVVDFLAGIGTTGNPTNLAPTFTIGYGTSGNKELSVTSTDDIDIYNNNVAGQVTPISDSQAFLTGDETAFSLTFGSIVNGDVGEAVTEVGFTVLSRTVTEAVINVTANYSGGGSSSITGQAIASPLGSADTFFHFAAPTGESITSLDFDNTGTGNVLQRRLPIDDFAIITGVPGTAKPTNIVIENHSFEEDAIGDGTLLTSGFTGWQGEVNTSGDHFFFDRNGATLATTTDATPHDDANIGGDGSGEQGALLRDPGNHFFQVLSTNLEANTTYTLTVDVGDRENTVFSGAELRLGSGNTFGNNLLTADSVTNPTPLNNDGVPDDGWETWVTTFTTGATVPAEALRVELLNNGVAGGQALYDNVRLTAEAAPGPITDSFDSYTDGANLNGLNGGTGWTSAWSSLGAHATIESTHPFSGSGNAVQIQPTADLGDTGSFLSRDFAAVTDTLYVGMEINKSTGFDNADFINFQFRDSSGSDQLGFGVRNQTDNPIFARVQGGSTVSVNTSTNAEPGTTYQVIAKISKDGSTNYNRVDLYIDPTGTTEPGAADATATAATGVNSLSRLNVRHFSPELGDVFWFDNLQLSSTFEGALAPDPTAPPAIITPVIAESTSTIGTPRIIDATIDGSGLAGGGNSFNVLAETHEFVPQATTDTYWLSSAGAVSRGDEVLTFTLPSASDIDAVHQWVYTRGGSGGDRGLQTFDISFSTDGGTTYPTTIDAATLGNFTKPVANTSVESETKTFAQQTGVTHVRLSNLQNFGDASYFGLTEIRFGGTPSVVTPTLANGTEIDPANIISGTAQGTIQVIDVPYLGTGAIPTPGVPTNIGPDHPGTADDGFVFSTPHSNTNYNERTQQSQWEPDGTPIGEALSYSVSGGPNGAQTTATPDGTWTFDLPDGALVKSVYATWTGQGNNGRRLEWGYDEGTFSETSSVQQTAAGPNGDLVLRWTDSDSNTHDADFQQLFSGNIVIEGGDGFTVKASENWNEGWLDAVAIDYIIPTSNTLPTFTAFDGPVEKTLPDSEVEITFNELQKHGDEADDDGFVGAFVVQAVSSGTLKIGADAGSATAFAAGSNDTIDATNKAYWTPDSGATGTGLDAFTVLAQDNVGGLSVSPVQATVDIDTVPIGIDVTGNIVTGTATGTLLAIDVPNLSDPVSTPSGPDWTDDADDGFRFLNGTVNERTQTSQWEPDGTALADARSYSISGGSQNLTNPDVSWTFDVPDGAVINEVYATWTVQGNNGRRLLWGYDEGAASDSASVQQSSGNPAGDLVLQWTDSDSNTHNANFQRLFTPGVTVEGGDGFTVKAAENWNEGWVDTVVIDVTFPPSLDAVDDNYTSNPITEDEVLNIGASGSVLINDTGTGLDAPTLITGVTVPTDSANLSGQNGGFNRLAEYVVNGAGFDGTAHDNTASGGMWMESNGDKTTGFITFDLGANYDLDNVHVWNYNEFLSDRGANEVEILISNTVGGAFTSLGDYNFAQAPGTNGYLGEVIDLSDKPAANDARMVRFNIKSNHGGGEMGLSEVRFYAADTDTTLATYDTTSANGAAVTVNPDGTFTYDPTSSVTLQALNDGDSLTDTFTYTLAGEESALIYDGFDYATGGIEGENGGIGFAGAWDAPRNNPVVDPDSKDFGGLITTGNHLRGPAWANVTRPIGSTLSDAGLMDDGSTLWFSVVVDLDGQNLTNADLNFALGTDQFESGVFGDRQNLVAGEAIGFGHNRGTIQGVYWQNTDADTISERNATNTSLVLNNSNNSRALIVGKIDWGNGATANETLTLYAPGTDLALGTEILSMTTPALDQSVFDSVLVQFKDRPQIDEIRFGASYDDVNGPETATATVSIEVSGVTDVTAFDAVDDASYASTVISDSPALYWRMDAASGTTESNLGSLGATGDGTYVETPNLGVSGAVYGSTAVNFDADTDRAVTSGGAVIPAATFSDNTYTVEMWFNADAAVTGNQDLLAIENGSNGYGILLELSNSNRLRFLHRPDSGGDTNIFSANEAITPGQWHHLVAVSDNGAMTLYLDGTSLGTATNNGAIPNSDMQMTLGQLGTNTARQFNGGIDEVAVYGVALTQEQIDAHIAAASSPILDTNEDSVLTIPLTATDSYAAKVQSLGADGSLIGFWNFNEGSGGIAADSSGNGNDGTITGASYTGDGSGFSGEAGNTALDFGNGNDRVVIASAASGAFADTATNNAVTVSLWQNGDAAQPQSDTIFSGRSSGQRQFQSHLPWSNSNVYWDTGGAGYNRVNQAASTDQFEGQWNHWTFVKDGDETAVYVNGEFFMGRTGQTNVLEAINEFVIGAESSGGANDYNGLIDEFAVFSKGLTAAEVADLYAAATPHGSLLGNDTVSLDPVVVASFDVNNGGSATQSGFASLSSTGTGTQNGITLTSSAGMDEYRDRGAVAGSSDSDVLRDFGFENDASRTVTFDLTGLKSNTEYDIRIFSFDDDANNGVTSDWYEGAVGGTLLLTHTNNASDPDSGDFTVRLTSDATGAIQISGASSALVIFNGMTVAEIPQPIVGIQGTASLTGISDKGAAVTVNPDGSFTYDPTGSAELQALAAGENTTDTFTYTISEPLIGNGSLIGHYPLDELSGGTTPGENGTPDDGTVNGAVTAGATGKIGGAFDFVGGSGNNVVITDPGWGQDAFTASVWFRPDSLGSGDAIGNWTNSGPSPRTFLVRTDDSGILQTYLRDDTNTLQNGGNNTFATQSISTTEFNHVMITYDGQNLRTYLNGEQSNEVRSFSTPTAIGAGVQGTASIGGRGSSEQNMDGVIDDVAFWSETLTEEKVNVIYNLADEADLNYDAGQANLLFRVFDGGAPAVTIGDLRWTRASGLGGNAGDVVDLGGGNYFVNIDGTSGVASSEPITATVTIQVNGVNDAPIAVDDPSYEGIVLTDNPLGYWRLGESNGATVALDSSGNGNDLAYQNGAGSNLEQSGATADGDTAAELVSGGTDQIQSPNTTAFGFASGDSFTIEYWTNFEAGNASTNDAGLISKGYDSAQDRPWYISRLRSNGTVDFFLRNSGGTNRVATSTTNVEDGTWHHVVGVYDATAAQLRIYVDAELEGTATGVPADSYGTNSRAFTIGNHLNRQVDGQIDEVAVYGAALTQEQIEARYAVALNPAYQASEDKPLTVGADGVLANDIEIDINGTAPDDSLTVVDYDAISAKGAAVTVNPDGSFTYDPTGSDALQALAVGEEATDTFTYTITDASVTDTSVATDTGTLIGHYSLDEVIGGSTPDSTGRNVDGTVNGAVTAVAAGKIGGALDFVAGNGNNVVITDPGWGQDAFTASVWFRPDSLGSGDAIGNWTNGGPSPRTFLVRTDNNGTLQTFLRDDTNSLQNGGSNTFATQSISTTEFNHVMITYDGQNLRTYLNGEQSNEVRSFSTPTAIGAGVQGTASIGGRGSSEQNMDGVIDDVAFWSETLTEEKVNAIFSLADSALNYDAGKANQLFQVFDGSAGIALVDDLAWSRASGLGGSAGEVVDLGGGNFFLNLDGTAGVVSSPTDTATVTVNVTGANDAPEFLTDDTFSTTTGVGGTSGQVDFDNGGGAFGGAQWHVKNGGPTSGFTRKGYIRMDVSDISAEVDAASLDLQISTIQNGQAMTVSVYGITDESLDSVALNNSLTWSTAPANDTSSGFAADLTKATLLGTISVPASAVSGDTVSLSSNELADFLNTDTDGIITLILGRSGGNTTRNFLPAGESNATLDPPTLRVSYGSVTEGTIIETTDAGPVDSDPAPATGTLVFGDVDLSDSHTTTVLDAFITGGTATLSAEQEAALLNNLTVTVDPDSTNSGIGEVDWTYTVPNSEIDFLAKGETIEVTHTVAVTDSQAAVTSFHDLGGQASPGNITTQTTLGTTVNLIDFEDGSDTGIDFSISGANGIDTRTGTVTLPPAANTPASDIFLDSGIDLNDGLVFEGGTNGSGSTTFTLTGLDPEKLYDFALYGDRNFAADGVERFTLNGAESATNSSSIGIVDDFITDMDTRSNAASGDVVRWKDIAVGADGTITIDIDPEHTSANNIAYLSAFRLVEQATDTQDVVVTIIGENDIPQFETDATVTTLTGEGGTAGQVRLGSNETGSFGGTQFHVKNSGNGSTTRKGYIRMDVSELNFPIAEASLDLTVSREDIANNSHVQTIHVYGLTNESLDNWDTSTATWAGAPGNNTGSPHQADATDATFLGTFTYQGSEGVGVTKSFSDPRLVDFLNSDTNGQVTFILGRTGPSGGANLLFAGNTHASLAPPTLNVASATQTEGSITETADVVGGTDADPTDATGTLVFSDVDLIDTHTASVIDATVTGGTATLTQEQEDNLLDNLSLGSVTQNPDGSGSFDWTYDVPNSEIDFLAEGETVDLSYTISTDDGQGLLFADNFDRPNNGDLDASTAGMSGSLGALSWGERPIPSNSALDINNNTLRTNSAGSPGQQGGIAWPEHNFVDAGILAAGEFTVSVDINEQSSGGDGRIAGFAIGQSLADLQSRTSSSVASTADFQIGYDDIGNTRGITVYHNGSSQGRTAFTASRPDTLSATFKVTDFNAGSTIDYEVFLDGVSITTGSTTWSGTEENYISLQSNSTNNTRFDNFSVSAPSSDTATVNVTITGTNDAPEIAPSAEVSTITTNTGSDGVSGHVRRGADETGSFGGGQIAIKNSGNGSTTRKGYIRMDVSDIDYTVADASLDLTISLRDSALGNNIQTFHVYGMNDGNLDNWDPSTSTWFNAPANDTGSAFEADLNEAIFLGTFTSGGSDRVGDTLSFSDPRLADFLNADTNGLVTFIIGRTGTDDFRNFGFAGDNHASLAPPTLNISAAHNPEGQVTEDLDATTLTDEGIIAFSDVDLTDTHTATVQPSALNTYGGTLTLGAVVDDSTSDSGHVRWTYEVDNSAVQALAVGQTDTETFTVLIDDGNGGSTTETVKITITGTNDAPEITQDDTPVALTETDAPLDATGTFDVTDIDLSDTVDATIEDEITVGGTGVVSLPASLTANDNQALKDMFSLTSTNPVIASGTATATLNSNDFIVGESSGSSATTPGYYTSSTNGGSTIVGVGGPGTNRTDRAMILGYTLPTLAPGETVDSVDFSFEITRARNGNGGILPNLDVYLLNTATPETTGTDFFYQGADDPSEDAAFVGKTTVSIAAGGEVTFPDDSEDRTFTLTGDSLRMFKSFYNGNTPTQTEVFFRFNLDAAASLGSFDRYRIDTAADESGVEITTANETGTIDWEFDSDPEAFDFLAKDETLELTYTVSASDGNQDVLFADSFNRDNSTDLDASTDGMSGSLGALNWGGTTVPSSSDLEINGNTLLTDAASTPGGQGAAAWPNHNFIDADILAAGEFTVSVDIASLASGGNGRYPGFAIGQSLADLQGLTSVSPGGSPADVFVAYDDIGSARGITIFHDGSEVSRTAFTASRPDTLSATFTVTDFNAGSTIDYEVFLDGVSITTGSTVWSGTDENYISLQSNSTGDTRFDNFSVSVPSSDTATVSVTITGTNDAPIATLTGNDISENGMTTVTGTIVDPDLSDTHTVIIDWDDPNNDTDSTFDVNKSTRDLAAGDTFTSAEDAAVILTIDAVDTTTGTITYSAQRQYLDDGLAEATFNPATPEGNATASDVSNVSVEVTDNIGASDTAGFDLIVSNVLPVMENVAISADVINENGSVTVSGDIVDPGTLDAFRVRITWGDGKLDAITLPAGSTSFSLDHVYDVGGRSYNIRIQLLDDDLGVANAGLAVRVINVPPTLEANPIPDVVVGETSVLTGSFTDPGLVLPHTVVVDWGDGTSSSFEVPPTGSLEAGDRVRGRDGSILTVTDVDITTGEVNFTVSHEYENDGIFNVSVTVGDETFTVTAQLTATVFLIGPTDTTPGIFTNQPGENNLVGILSIFRNMGDTGLFVGFRADDAEDDRLLDGIMTEEGTPDFLGDLTLAPFFAGTTQPGATVVVILRDEVGNEVASTTIISDLAGNWTATFPELEYDEGDYNVEIQVTNPIWSSIAGSFESQIAAFNGSLLGAANGFEGLTAGQIIGIAVDTQALDQALQNEKGLGKQ